jgi:hypothetical protein
MSSEGATKLQYALKTLRVKWDETVDAWSDKVRHDYETNHMIPLERQVETTIRGMDELAEILSRMKREVGDARD